MNDTSDVRPILISKECLTKYTTGLCTLDYLILIRVLFWKFVQIKKKAET